MRRMGFDRKALLATCALVALAVLLAPQGAEAASGCDYEITIKNESGSTATLDILKFKYHNTDMSWSKIYDFDGATLADDSTVTFTVETLVWTWFDGQDCSDRAKMRMYWSGSSGSYDSTGKFRGGGEHMALTITLKSGGGVDLEVTDH